MSRPIPPVFRFQRTLHRTGKGWARAVVLVAILLAGRAPLLAQICDQREACDRFGCGRLDCATPACPVPSSLWSGLGELQPADPQNVPLPLERDATSFNEFTESYYGRNWYEAVDIENGYLITGLGYGLQVWDARSTPATPELKGTLKYSDFPYWNVAPGEFWPLEDVDAPEGDDTIAALVGRGAVGIAIVDLQNKGKPRVVYQNRDKEGREVYTAKINGTAYAFLAATNPGGGVYVYNMSQALQANGCAEATPGSICRGVYVSTITQASITYIHGVDHFVVFSGGTGSGFQIWDVADPQHPQKVLSGLEDPPTCIYDRENTYGVAMWKDPTTGRYYLGLRTQKFDCGLQRSINEARIYDVSCIANGPCGGLGSQVNPLTQMTMDADYYYVTFSKSGSTPFLYFGSNDRCADGYGSQREWLFNVSNPASPREITAPGYWNFYYRGSSTGFNYVSPRRGKFAGDVNGTYFYRAGLSIMDIHRWGAVLPPQPPAVASVTVAPNPAAVCQQVTFTANGITGQPSPSLSWVLNKGGVPLPLQPPGSSSSTFTWNTTGAVTGNDYTATVKATNSAGMASATSLQLTLNPTPSLPADGSFTPTYEGQPVDPPSGTVTFHLADIPGVAKWTWDFGDGTPFTTTDPILGPNPPAHSYLTIGTKQVQVTVQNCDNTASVKSAILSVNITQTTPLKAAFQATSCPINICDVVVGSPVTFADNSTGAEFWDYDWTHTGTNKATCNFPSGPPDGGNTSPVLSHTYTAAGTFQPCLRVRRGTSEQDSVVLGATLIVKTANPPFITISGPTTAQVGDTLNFSALASNCNPSTGTWSWTMTGGTPSSGSGSAVSVSYAAAGFYNITVSNTACAGATGLVGVNVSGGGGGGGGTLAAAFTFLPNAPNAGQAVRFDGSASTGTPDNYHWDFGDGGSAGGSTASHTFAGVGIYRVTLTISKFGTGTGCVAGICVSELTQTVAVGGGPLAAAFNFAPGAPTLGQAVSFDGSTSTGNPTQYSWDFGDGNTGTGQTVSHTFTATGSYSVKLTVANATASPASVVRTVVVTTPPLDASFQSDGAQCVLQFCSAATGATVTLTALTTQATTYSWDFGDGTKGTGRTVTHAWNNPKSYTVQLTVTNAQTSAAQTRSFEITGNPVPTTPNPVLLPWVAQSRGVLVQSSDLYAHNPGSDPIDVTLEFRKRGTPDVNPPKATRTIQPGQTLYVADVLGSLFNQPNLTGFVSIAVTKGTTQPIITSFNTVTHTDGTKFAQAVSGVPMPPTSPISNAATGPVAQQLVGLNNNSDRTAVFGITNPGSAVATYHLSFFDRQGQPIGHPADVTVSPFGQRQFQPREIRDTFGIPVTDDYRVQVETGNGGLFYPYDADLRNGSSDPSYFGAGSGTSAKTYLLGGMSAPDGTGGAWKTDAVLTNVADQPMKTTLTFTRIGLRSTPERPVTITLQPGETQRLANVIASQWKLTNTMGLLTVESAGVTGTYPIVQGESYDDAKPFRFGQAMAPFTDGDAAGPGQMHHLVGLRQNADYRSQLWLFNPGTEGGSYDLVYRALDGSILGRINGFLLAPGTIRQVRPVDHPIPAKGVTGGFTVQIVVNTGKVLAAAQVINTVTSDPAYVSGKTQK
jgi:PKD repeat protein